MRDAYQTRKTDLDAVLAAFPLQDGQQGMLVLHGARVVGLDLVSRAPQYAELHDKLLRSYAFEALVRDGEPGRQGRRRRVPRADRGPAREPVQEPGPRLGRAL